jgi:hypothetical protein
MSFRNANSARVHDRSDSNLPRPDTETRSVPSKVLGAFKPANTTTFWSRDPRTSAYGDGHRLQTYDARTLWQNFAHFSQQHTVFVIKEV